MATVNVTASDNIKNIIYGTGDTLNLTNSANGFVRLTIDAQDAADVTAVETVFPGRIDLNRINGELYIVNNSTTVPLILKFSDSLLVPRLYTFGPASLAKIRGGWISLGTSNGTLGQTISSVIGGKTIDYPPYIQAELTPGSGDAVTNEGWVTMMNIGGAYRDSVGPTSYVIQSGFAEVGTTRDLGAFFEYDEENSLIKLATAAGGWVPPNGCAIRIPNIHFTLNRAAHLTYNSRGLVLGTAFQGQGTFDFERCSFSNRWVLGSNTYLGYTRLRDVGFCGPWGNLGSDGPYDIDGMYSALDVWLQQTNGLTFSNSPAELTLNNIHSVIRSHGSGSIAFTSMAIGGVVKSLGEVRTTILNRTTSIANTFNTGSVTIRANDPASPPNFGPVYGIGGSVTLAGFENVRFKGVYQSDTSNGTPITTIGQGAFTINNNKNVVIETVGLADGGAPTYSFVISLAGAGVKAENVVIHDVNYDTTNPTTGLAHSANFGSVGGKRTFISNVTLGKLRSGVMAVGNTVGEFPSRISNLQIDSNTFTGATLGGGGVLEMTWDSITPSFALAGLDNNPFVTARTNGTATGQLGMAAGGIKLEKNVWEATAGTLGTDYNINGASALIPGTGVVLQWNAIAPSRGVTAFTGATIVYSGTSATSGTTYEFRMCNWGDDITAATWTGLSSANLQTVLAALTGYDSDVGFNIQIRVTTSSVIANRALTYILIHGCAIDAGFTAPEIGFIQISYTGGTDAANIAAIDVLGTPVQRDYQTIGVSGEGVFEYPYAFDGVAAQYKIVARKAGYRESIIASSCYQAGASVPLAQIAAHPCTDADVADIAVDGVAKTLTITASKTGQQLYQKAQWWAHQRTNMIYDTPVTSNDGNTLSIPATWGLIGAANISDAVTIAGCTVSSITAGALIAAFDNCTLQLGAAGTYTFAESNGTVEVTPSAPSTYNFGGGEFGATLTVKNTTTHAITIQIPGGVTGIDDSDPGKGVITFLSATNTLTVAANVSLAGAEVRIYDLDSSGIHLGTELGGTESCPGTTFDLAVSGGNTVWVQILKAGYVEFGQAYVMPMSSSTFNASLVVDVNA